MADNKASADRQKKCLPWTADTGLYLLGLEAMAAATGVKDTTARDTLDALVTPDGGILTGETCPACLPMGRLLFPLCREEDGGRFRAALARLAAAMDDLPKVWQGAEALWQLAPFWMTWERDVDKNAQLAALTALFADAREAMAAPLVSARDTGWYLMALADCVELCEQQIFEHYKALVDDLRTCLRGLLSRPEGLAGALEGDPAALMMALYALYKAIRLGLLDWEKYLPLAEAGHRALTAALLAVPDPQGREGALTAAMVLLYEAEMTLATEGRP